MQLYKKHGCLSVCFKTLYKFAHTKSYSGSFLFFNICLYCYMHIQFIYSKCCMVLQGVQTHFTWLNPSSDGRPDSSTSSCLSHFVPSWVAELWVPDLIEHCQITVQNGCAHLHSFQQCRRVPVIQCPHQILYYLTFNFCHSHRV